MYSSLFYHKSKLSFFAGEISHWSVDDIPQGLSVTKGRFNVIVTCYLSATLKEYTTHGGLVRLVTLQPDIVHPRHAVKLTSGQYVVCHGLQDDPEGCHRLSIVGPDGLKGSQTLDSVISSEDSPLHIAVDKHGFIFVIDNDNKKVLLLNPALTSVREILSRDQGLRHPVRVRLDEMRGRVYVTDNLKTDDKYASGRVLVFNVKQR